MTGAMSFSVSNPQYDQVTDAELQELRISPLLSIIYILIFIFNNVP